MSRRSVELAFEHGAARKALSVPNPVEAELDDLERQIARNRDQPIPALLSDVVDRICALTRADGAAIAVRDQGDVVCKASVGDAPEVGSRLQPDSALTRQCFETGTVVLCDDTETDYRVRSATVKSLHLRSAVVVPIQVHAALGVVEVLGLIEVLSSRPFAFDIAHVDGLKRVAELLAPVLVPVQPQESGESIPAVITMPFQAEAPPSQLPAFAEEPQSEELRYEEPNSKTPVFIVSGAVLLLALLLIASAFLLRRPPRNASTPSAEPAQPAQGQQGTPSAGNEARHVQPESRSHSEASVPTSSSSSSISSPPPVSSPAMSAKSAEAVRETPSLANSDVAKDRALSGIRPTVPALVIRGVPPGSQIFVDDRVVSSTGQSGTSQSGETSISTLSEGQHRLRLRLDGYRDLDQGFEVQTGKTSTITAKLEPLLPPPSGSAKPPTLALTPAVTTAVPPPVTPSHPSLPDFVLDRTLKAHSGWVTAVAFSPDGQRLASGSWDRTLKFWQVGTGEQLNSVASKMKEVQSLAFSRDGHWLATENSSDTVTLRNPTTGQEILALPTDKPLGPLGSNWVYSISFSPDGRWLASGVDDKTVRLWDVQTGRKVRDLTGLRRPVIYIAFSPDGQLLATGDDSKTIRIWDVGSGEQIYKLSGHKKGVNAVAFSPNGRRLASASADKTVKLWDLTTGREVHTLTGHENVVTSLAFSPDGRWLISGSWDKTVKIWDVETGRELQTLAGHDHPVYSVAFDSRGRWLASGSEDGTIKLWRLTDATDQSKLQQ